MISPAQSARFDRVMEMDEAARLRSAWQKRLASACRADRETAPEWDRLAELNGHADAGFIEGAEIGLEVSAADRAFAFSAEGEFLALSIARTGETIAEEKIKEMRADSAKLLEQSLAIAKKMGKAGFDCFRETPFKLVRYHVHSRHTEMLPGFRRVTFIPSVAQSIRAPMLAALESFIERNPFCRMWTMTSGPRVPLCGIRDRARWMHGKISDLNAQPFMRAAGVEIVFRSTELGTPETDANGNPVDGGEIETDEDGQMYFNVHAHCVVALKSGFISPKKWEALLNQVGVFWVHWWKDGGKDKAGRTTSGRIVDAREVCKYVTKPGEMMKLSGAQLVALQAQLSRLKLVQPMGQLAEEMKRRADPANPLRLIRTRTKDGAVYREVKNWNRQNRLTRLEKIQDAVAKLDQPDNGANKQRVVARQLPGYGPAGVSEPVVVVMTTAWDEAAVRADKRVAALIAATAGKFAAGLAKPISVHTCTPTVQETRPLPFPDPLPLPRKLLTGAELAGYSR